jgi:nitrite reductase (NO-forming)
MTPSVKAPQASARSQALSRRPRRAARWFARAVGLLPFLAPAAMLACDACNLSFARQLVEERADSVIARDLKRAMHNQGDLNLVGYSNPDLMKAQMAMLDGKEKDDPPQDGSCSGGPGCAMCATEAPVPTATESASDEASAAVDDSLEATIRLAESTATPVGTSVPSATPEMSPASLSDRPIATPAPAPGAATFAPRELPAYMRDAEFIEILERDYALPTTPSSTVPQNAPVDKKFTIRMSEGKTYIGNGVVYDGFLLDGKVPGPTVVVEEGDVVEMEFVNEGTIPHGASIHAASTQTSKYVGKLGVGETKSVVFRAMMPGVYMYHCAPGGHAIGMHVIGGQYGMIVVKPRPGSYQLEKELGHEPNLELYLIQHELYASGQGSIAGDPTYVLFNGRTFRYVEEPILAKPGDYVRINFLNVGPNILSTFHIVGIIWDYVYWQGHPEARLPGGQTVTAGPSDSFVIEFRMPPDEGAYTMLTHAVGSTSRGAIGLIVVDDEAELEPHRTILADGPAFNEAEMRGYESGATRVIAPFGIGSHAVDRPVIYGPETKEVHVAIIGNSFHPKVVQVAPGTKVTWTNEDVFTYLGGEYSGVHNAAGTSAPEGSDGFSTPLLAHGESSSHVFEGPEWEYEYICTPHPYMRGKVIVKEPDYALGSARAGNLSRAQMGPWLLPILGLSLLLSTAAIVMQAGRRRRET